jgi:serine/threonine protein kinase
MSNSAHASKTIIPIRYAAPEVLQNPNGLKHSEKSDVYSMGNLIWEACSYGEIPYISIDNDDDVRQRVLNGERLPRPALCNDKLWALINECWHQNPKRRPNFQTLKESFRSNQQSIMNRTLVSTIFYMESI